MSFTRAGQLARHTPVALLDTPLGLAAENLRESRCAALPVLDRLPPDPDDPRALPFSARVLGLIDERDLSRAALPALQRSEAARLAVGINGFAANGGPPLPLAVAPNGNGHAPDAAPSEAEAMRAAFDAVRDLSARDVMRADWGFVPQGFSLHNTLLALDRYDASALPVVDEAGGYKGMIARADVLAALGGQVRPPSVGGMATPLGVWLTTGNLSGGAPTLGLFLSGLTLGALLVTVHLLLGLGLNALQPAWGALYESGRLGAGSESGSFFNLAVTVVELFAFLGAMRLIPLAGTHAAEHQTVHAIERGLPLRPEIVKTMPRAHPRCGTNLVALGAMIQIIFQHLPSFDPTWVVGALLFVFFAWRSFGTALQNVFTTRPASPRQLASGIRAGEELLAKYQAQPHVRVGFGAALFNSGIVFSGLGMMAALWLASTLQDLAARFILR